MSVCVVVYSGLQSEFTELRRLQDHLEQAVTHLSHGDAAIDPADIALIRHAIRQTGQLNMQQVLEGTHPFTHARGERVVVVVEVGVRVVRTSAAVRASLLGCTRRLCAPPPRGSRHWYDFSVSAPGCVVTWCVCLSVLPLCLSACVDVTSVTGV